MGRHSTPTHIAHVQDANSDGEVDLDAERRYARSTAPSSPLKEKPNTSRSRRDSRRMRSVSPPEEVESLADSSDSVDRTSSRRASKTKSKEERRKSNVVVKRPSARTTKTTPAPSSRLSDDSSYYGVQTVPASTSIRPRAHTRPETYYGQSAKPARPPLSSSAFYHPAPPSQFPPPSYPPPQWSGHGQRPFNPLMPRGPPVPPPSGHDYFIPPRNRELSERFQRPSSAMGLHAPRGHEVVKDKVARRSSMSRKTSKEHRDHEDRRRMPPPPRPASTRPERERVVLRPPQPQIARKSVEFDTEYFDPSMDREVTYGDGIVSGGLRRRSYTSESLVDDFEDLNIGIENPRSRRNSRYEAKLETANRYQNDVSSQGAALTVDAVKHMKHGTSSRSTRSSASRDESDYKHSAPTRTTRSSSGDDDITIKVPSGAVVEVGNTKIRCQNGGDMTIGRSGTSRGGSEHTTSVYSEDVRSRSERQLLGRPRAGSQASTFRRPLPLHAPPMYAPPHGYPYGHHLEYAPSVYDSNGQSYF